MPFGKHRCRLRNHRSSVRSVLLKVAIEAQRPNSLTKNNHRAFVEQCAPHFRGAQDSTRPEAQTMEYQIIRGNDPGAVGRQVTEALKNGWILHGGLGVGGETPLSAHYAQALTRDSAAGKQATRGGMTVDI
ncbi:DUF1737 domain-containing protein [Longimicrobium sp.]|uniref:DUF1737 domain-containing protein n=1 Tax=Longimicrobium sp. TaxID=2029185 RepID=UPI003B3AF2BC